MRKLILALGVMLLITAGTLIFLVGVGLSLWGVWPYIIGIAIVVPGFALCVLGDKLTNGKAKRAEEKKIRNASIRKMKVDLNDRLAQEKAARDAMFRRY